MPDDKIKISALPSALSLNNTDELPVVQESGGSKTTKRSTVQALGSHIAETMNFSSELETTANSLVEAINEAASDKNLADQYSNLLTYEVGDFVIYKTVLYKCITAVTVPEDFDSTKWTVAKVSDLVGADMDNYYTKDETDGKIEELIDDTQALDTNVWSSKKTYDEIYNILPTGNASGSIANFNTSLALPLVSAKFDVNATQEAGTPTPQSPKAISGVSAVNVTECGVNLNDEIFEGGYLSSSGAEVYTVNSIRNKNYQRCFGGQSFYALNGVGATVYCCFYDENKNFISRNLVDNIAKTTPNGAFYYRYSVYQYGSESYDANTKPLGFNYPSTDTDYHAYNGNTTTIQLGQTVYGGYVEQDKDGHRELTITSSKYVITGNETFGFTGSGQHIMLNNQPIYQTLKLSPDNQTLANMKCTVAQVKTYSQLDISGTTDGIGVGTSYLIVGSEQYDNWSNLAGEEIVYELKTPITIDLPDGTPINTLSGVNNVFADSGDITVKYKKSIDDAIAELQALILNA